MPRTTSPSGGPPSFLGEIDDGLRRRVRLSARRKINKFWPRGRVPGGHTADDAVQAAIESFLAGERQQSERDRLLEHLRAAEHEAAWMAELMLDRGLKRAELAEAMGREPREVDAIMRRLRDLAKAHLSSNDHAKELLGRKRGRRWNWSKTPLENLWGAVSGEIINWRTGADSNLVSRSAEIAELPDARSGPEGDVMRRSERDRLLERLRAADREAAWMAELMLDRGLKRAELAEAMGREPREVDAIMRRLMRSAEKLMGADEPERGARPGGDLPAAARREGRAGGAEPAPTDAMVERLTRQVEAYQAERGARPGGDGLTPGDRAGRRSGRNGLFEHLRAADPEAARMAELMLDRGPKRAELAGAMGREPHEIVAIMRRLKGLAGVYRAEEAQLLERLRAVDPGAARVAQLMLNRTLGSAELAEAMGREPREVDVFVGRLGESITNRRAAQ